MGFTEKISLIFDVDSSKGVRSLKDLKSSVTDADGVMGKLKAGASGVGGVLKENMAAAAVTAGTALVAFGVKAVGAFTDTAKAAIDLGAATGLSTEEASRWIAIGDDMGVTAEQLTSGLGKIGKTLDSGKWEQYGVATRSAGGEARSTNAILLDSFDKLGKITNETERAKAGNDLFGKGYANLAPLIGKTKGELQSYLGSVEKGQVITDKEAKKAEKMRLAQDALADAFGEVTLAVGELVAEAAPALDAVAKGVTLVADAVGMFHASGFTASIKSFGELSAEAERLGIAQGKLAKIFNDSGGDMDVAAVALGKLVQSTKDQMMADALASVAAQALSKDKRDDAAASEEAAASTRGLSKDRRDDTADAVKQSRATADVKSAIDKMDAALQILKGHLSERDAWANVQSALDDLKAKVESGEATWADLGASTDDAVEAVANYIETAADIPPEIKTQLYAALDQGKLDDVLNVVDAWKRGYQIPLYPHVVTSKGGPNPGAVIPIVGAFDQGGVVPGPNGQAQLAMVHSGETILPTHKGGGSSPVGGDTYNITINAPTGNAADIERTLMTSIKRRQARGGQV